MEKSKQVYGDAGASSISILGKFEGECADSNITNLNGLDITRPVWENVFSSDEYQRGIELGHYIGFLGHPDDPNCMDFEHACIVMTDGRIDDDGKIYGSFNLIDTPVGRIVKTFIDAGVKFGISVRGAGDITDNSVDPDTFVFRGFDLVAFPAYPESIPEFVAASSDVDSQKKYKAIRASVVNNISGINTIQSAEILQKHFAKQSDVYALLQSRKDELLNQSDVLASAQVEKQRTDGVMKLYLEAVKANQDLAHKLEELQLRYNEEVAETSKSRRKLAAVRRITSSQVIRLKAENAKLSDKLSVVIASSQGKSQRLKSVSASRAHILESRKMKSDKLRDLTQSNLKYEQKVESVQSIVAAKDAKLSSLKSELAETVRSASELQTRTSNLDEKNRRLSYEISECKRILAEYQDAYADMYANAVGVHLEGIPVSASTSVDELRKIIRGAVSGSTTASSDPISADVIELEDDDNGLITL